LCRAAEQKTKKRKAVIVGETGELQVGNKLGRIYAVLEEIHRLATGTAFSPATYDGAISSPAVKFAELIKKANHDHLPELKPNDKERLNRLLTGAMNALDADPFPQHLDVDQQERFVLSMQAQKAAFVSA